MVKNALKKAFYRVASTQLILRSRVRRIASGNAITILNMHRVACADGSEYRPLDPGIFEATLHFLRSQFEFTTFAEINEPGLGKPKLIISFDDGYKDFLEVAAPILEKFGVRCNHNIIPECVETGFPPLNVLVQDFIGKAPVELIKDLHIPGYEKAILRGSGPLVSRFLKNRSMESQRILKESIVPQIFRWQEFSPTQMMSRSDVLEISKVHEVGAHSFSHASMHYETPEFLISDVQQCKDYFREKLALPMDIYAFPNGGCTEEQVEILLNAGVNHVLLVGDSFSKPGKVHNRFTFDGLSLPEAKVKALGGFSKIR